MKKQAIKLTKFELELMEAFWDLGSAAIREIHEALPEKKRPAFTTVQTMVRRLEEKGAVRQVKKIGNAIIFEAVVSKQSAHRKLIDELLAVFGGSVRPLMAHLAEAGKLKLEDIRAIEEMLAETEANTSETRAKPTTKK